MAARKKDGRFKKGESGNPNGRPKLPPELKQIKQLSPSYVKTVIAKLTRMSKEQITEWIELPMESGGPNLLEMMVASVINQALSHGDHSKLQFLLDRSIGKVVEQHKVQVQPVTYKTKVREDGALLQEVVTEAIEEEK